MQELKDTFTKSALCVVGCSSPGRHNTRLEKPSCLLLFIFACCCGLRGHNAGAQRHFHLICSSRHNREDQRHLHVYFFLYLQAAVVYEDTMQDLKDTFISSALRVADCSSPCRLNTED